MKIMKPRIVKPPPARRLKVVGSPNTTGKPMKMPKRIRAAVMYMFIGGCTNKLIGLRSYNFIGMSANKATTISVTRDTWKDLNTLKECGESMEAVIRKLLRDKPS